MNAEVRILHEGTLEKCTHDHGKKDWKRRYFVFKHILASNIRSLEFYSVGNSKNWRTAEPKGVLALYPGYEIIKVHEPKRHFVFEIKTIDHTYRLAAHSEDELNQWIVVLERENVVNSFYVDPETTDQMLKLGATGKCHLHVANSELRLLCAKDGRLLVAWPFTCLRRYMSARGKFIVEAGRRAPTGEGKFAFFTPQYDEIYKLLDNVVKSRAGHKPSHETLKKTHPVPNDSGSPTCKETVDDGYDQLSCIPVTTSSNTNSLKDTYAAPYGHLPSRDMTRTGPVHGGQVASQAASSDENRYNTQSQPMHGSEKQRISQHDKKPVSANEYNALDQRPAFPHQGQDMYSVLRQGPNPQTGTHQKETDDVYNVIGETLHSVPHASIQESEDVYDTLSSPKRNILPSSTSAPEETYNALDHGSPVLPPRKGNFNSQASVRSPKLAVRKLFDSTPDEIDNMYNTLNTQRHPPLPVRKTPEQSMLQKSQPEDEVYNMLDSASKVRPLAPPRRTSEQLTYETNMYNTLDSSSLGNSALHTTQQGSDEMYNTLNVARGGTSPIPNRPKSWTASSGIGDEMYNTLGNKTMASISPRDDDNMYDTLDKTRGKPSPSVPVPTQRSFLTTSNPARKDTLGLKGNSTSLYHSTRCPLDVSSSPAKTPQFTSSLDDPDSYASISYSALLSPKGTQKNPPIPVKRSSPCKTRKTSAPDVLSFSGHTGLKDVRKQGKGNVSNLKASLEAGGLDLTKQPRKPKMLSREGSDDLSPYEENAEQRGSEVLAENASVGGTLPNKPGRSLSSLSDHGEDIYDKLQHTAQVKPKSSQITKAKKSPKKH
ncbi:uncharacterized protein LOC111326613 [Stylophora pistillata]|uniref:Docking protein 1 n=1 Tax=Stylophora pistillata TaxID=50429 RepID=A0A2B4SFK9_STYPI|nr:uncharacterized protein LOC111326613 [Stylophora pistillata]PFX28156.1 Docking protein 1 [Stylophora pistillata]